MVFAGDMVRDEVDDNLQAGIVSASDQVLELLHAVHDGVGQVGVHIVIILDGVGRTCIPFDHSTVIFLDMEKGIIRAGSVFDDAGVPDVGNTQFLDACQSLRGEEGKLSYPVINNSPVVHEAGIQVAEPSGKYLVDDYFFSLFSSFVHRCYNYLY